MKVTVKRVYNLLPWLGESYSNYEPTIDLEYNERETNPKLIYAYLNYLIDEQFYFYLLQNVDSLNPERVNEAIEKLKSNTKNRIKYYNKIYKPEKN